MNALFAHDKRAVPPLALDVRMTENTGQMDDPVWTRERLDSGIRTLTSSDGLSRSHEEHETHEEILVEEIFVPFVSS